ncbi:hypothetical protein QOT17_020419 [Balamuthia mandrillaris]
MPAVADRKLGLSLLAVFLVIVLVYTSQSSVPTDEVEEVKYRLAVLQEKLASLKSSPTFLSSSALSEVGLRCSISNYPLYSDTSFYQRNYLDNDAVTHANFPRQLVMVLGAEGNVPEGIVEAIANALGTRARVLAGDSPLAAGFEALWGSGPLDVYKSAKRQLPQQITKEFMTFGTTPSPVLFHNFSLDYQYDLRHYPDLSDQVFHLLAEAQTLFKPIIFYRTPKEAAPRVYQLKQDITLALRQMERSLTLLNQQLQTLSPDDYLVIHYAADPIQVAEQLTQFLDLTLKEHTALTTELYAHKLQLTNAAAKPFIGADAEGEGIHGAVTANTFSLGHLAAVNQHMSAQRAWQWKFLEDAATASKSSERKAEIASKGWR